MAGCLYIHIPFCIRKCIYCDFLSLPYSEALARSYITSLCVELKMKSAVAGSLGSVYIGGGTPTILPPDLMSLIFSRVREFFSIERGAEITVEANPGSLNEQMLDALLAAGVNRLSIGAQSFHDGELAILGRTHKACDIRRSVELARRAGLLNLSVDLIYGIPGQTADSWEETLATAAGLLPAHISAYELTPEPATPLSRLIHDGMITPPDDDAIISMYTAACQLLQNKGFLHYEISNFAMPGRECLHNANYWNRGEYLAAGAGAHSFIGGVRTRNTADIDKYVSSLRNGTLPECDSENVGVENTVRERIMLGMRMRKGLQLKPWTEIGIDLVREGKTLIDDGFLETNDGRIRLTGTGILVSNTVIRHLCDAVLARLHYQADSFFKSHAMF